MEIAGLLKEVSQEVKMSKIDLFAHIHMLKDAIDRNTLT